MPINEVAELFVGNKIGKLMRIETDKQTRYQYEIWFEYTRQTMMNIKEGTLLAAKNFACSPNETHHSLLEITSIMPVHYALGDSTDGYPAFSMIAASNSSTDWLSQEDRSDEDTTIIKCIASPIDLELIETDRERTLCNESCLPMIGTDTRVLTSNATSEIINREITITNPQIFEFGKWLVDNRIPIYVNKDEFIQVHFGIFGFTKAGKSNLLSTCISRILAPSTTPAIPPRTNPVYKIVVFDLMSEYNVLLIDKLVQLNDAYLLCLGEQTLPESAINYLLNRTNINMAVNDIINTSLYPQALESIRDNFNNAIRHLLENNKIKIHQEINANTIGTFLNTARSLTSGHTGNSAPILNRFIENLRLMQGIPLNPEVITGINNAISQMISGNIDNPDIIPGILAGIGENTDTQAGAGVGRNARLTDTGIDGDNTCARPARHIRLTETAINNLRRFQDELNVMVSMRVTTFPNDVILNYDNIINILNNPRESSLIIIQSHDPDQLRQFSSELGNRLFEIRRRTGSRNSPLVSFIFDEADEFIPSNFPQGSSYEQSGRIIEQLARRGRKFRIGVGIATQRIRYLRTGIMAQPHTYLVSKLPRLTDREAIQEAFGFSEEIFNQTFKFSRGDWLIASHDATGLTGVPIPVHIDNANDRIITFINNTGAQANRGTP